MTVLRQRMLDDMRIRNLAAETQTSYLRQVAKFARYHGQSPELLGPEDIRTYQLHLIDDRQLAPTSVAGTVAALRFLYQVTLKRDWAVEALPLPKRGETLPVILSPEEVVRFLAGVARPKHRMILTTCYAAGLRLGEALRLQVANVDSNRMVLHVAQGKGARDRYVMLSPTLLQQLRAWWRVERPARWLFPGRNPEQPMQKGTVQWACRLARYRSRLGKPVTPHSLRHALPFTCWKSAPTSAPFSCCSVIGGWRPRRATSAWRRPRSVRRPARSTCCPGRRPRRSPRTDRGPPWLVRSFAWRRSSAATATCIVPGPGPRCRPRTCA